jgi:hypothetical protein
VAAYTELNYPNRVFPGADHGEGAWAERLDVALAFVAGRLRTGGGAPDKPD